MARTEIPITVIDLAGNAVSGASVRIKNRANGADRTVYAAETGATTVSNPLTTDAFGRVAGWVEQGRHYAQISGTGLTTYIEEFDAVPAFAAGFVATGGVLPASPQHAEEVYYEAGAGVVWRLRYNAGSVNVNKWEFVGGSPLRATVAGPISQTSSAVPFSASAITGGPQVTIPFPGDYEIEWAATGHPTAAAALDWRVGGSVDTALVAVATGGPLGSSSAALAGEGFSYKGRMNGCADAVIVQLRLACSVASVNFSLWDLTVGITPVRVRN